MSGQHAAETAGQSGWRVLQLRSLLSGYLAVIAILLLLLALLGGFFTYNTHVEPGTEVETVQESQWSSTGEFSHEAVVTEETDVFAEGEVLADQSAYLESVSPVLNGTFAYEYQASAGGTVQTDVEVGLVVRSVSEEGVEFWREERTLATQTTEGLEPGESATVPFSFNITALKQRISDIEGQLGTTPGPIDVTVESRTEITGQRNGRQLDQRRTYTMRVVPESQIYRVENEGPDQRGNEQIRQTTTTASYGGLRTSVPPLLLAGAVITGLAVTVAGGLGKLELSEREESWLSYCQDRSEFEEWLSAGSLPPESMPDRRIELSRLAGLVDLAIDSDRRVIEDHSRGLCAVVVDDVAYVYERPDPPTGGSAILSFGSGSTAAGSPATGSDDDRNESNDGN